MRASLVVICLLLTVALLVQGASARRPFRIRPRKSIWSHIRGNAADIKKLINENQQFEQEIGPVIDTLKENVDFMKEGFAAQTMLMAQMKTSMNDMKGSIGNLQKITLEPEEYNCQEDGIVYMHRAFPDAPIGVMKQARKSSEDAQPAGYDRFKKVCAG